MRTVVTAHIYHLACLLDRLERGFNHIIRLANERHNGAVCGLTRVYVQQLNALARFYNVCDLLDYCLVAPFTEVRHALYYLPCLCHSINYVFINLRFPYQEQGYTLEYTSVLRLAKLAFLHKCCKKKTKIFCREGGRSQPPPNLPEGRGLDITCEAIVFNSLANVVSDNSFKSFNSFNY